MLVLTPYYLVGQLLYSSYPSLESQWPLAPSGTGETRPSAVASPGLPQVLLALFNPAHPTVSSPFISSPYLLITCWDPNSDTCTYCVLGSFHELSLMLYNPPVKEALLCPFLKIGKLRLNVQPKPHS